MTQVISEQDLIEAMFNDFNIFFRDCRGKNNRFHELGQQKLSIPANIYADKEKMHIEIAIVGADPEAIIVEKVNRDTIKIQYTKPEHEDETGRHYFSKNLSKKDIDLQLKIDSNYNVDEISPKYNQGLLVIDIPIAEDSKPNTFKVEA